MNERQPDFGFYTPQKPLPLLLIALQNNGFSHGLIKKFISGYWAKNRYPIVDAEVHGIKWRLQVKHNRTDMKLLSRSKKVDNIEIDALDKVTKNSTFVDIGANTGYYSLMLKKLGCSKVIAIEPNPLTLQALQYNIILNDYQNDITVYPVCVGDGNPVELYTQGDLGSSSLIKFNDSDDVVTDLVQSKPLLDIIQQSNIDSIGGMKLDIEGYEDRALEPFFELATPNLHPQTIVMEATHRSKWKVDIIDILIKKHSYKIHITKNQQNIILEKG